MSAAGAVAASPPPTWHYEGKRIFVARETTPGRNPGRTLGVLVEVVTEQGRTHRRRPLPPRLSIFNHSPNGFEWGYAGSGPAQLALAIVYDSLWRASCLEGSELRDRAIELHQRFKFERIAMLPHPGPWRIEGHEVCAWIAHKRLNGGVA